MARIAARAEAKALARALARGDVKPPADAGRHTSGDAESNASGSTAGRHAKRVEPPSLEDLLAAKRAEQEGMQNFSAGKGKIAFKSKKEREAEAMARLQEKRKEASEARVESVARSGLGSSARERERERMRDREKDREQREERLQQREKERELEMIRKSYLGGQKNTKRVVKAADKFKAVFQFDWEAGDDTSQDYNPLYQQKAQINALYGRGYIAGIDMREQRKDSAFLNALMAKRQEEQRRLELEQGLSEADRRDRERARARELQRARQQAASEAVGSERASIGLRGAHWSEKPLSEMAERDWRIFREDFDIRVKGGKAPLPLRNWEEGKLAATIMEAIEELGYKEPSPIQRQAIPIGLQFRDLIGIAETGSGKTAAFCIPMLSYIMSLPPERIERTPDDGPLAIVMAPTRELAQQIEEECKKFAKFTGLRTACVVGGQDIEAQGFELRRGVEIVIGTPGRLNDCLEKHYLVLNQCTYVVLDEADRMIDLGFEEQVLAVLDGMGGALKSTDETEALQQEEAAKSGSGAVRVTSMFSATMPTAVERMAKKYLRHPAIVQIGDEDTGKNKRITQHVLFMSEAQKKAKLQEQLRSLKGDNKALIFVNTKKTADLLARQLEQSGFTGQVGVLHGGKTQDQREANLEDFRAGHVTLLVATDVASRGLDIPDVATVLNYELPSKIETYCHRIGRTGRAGKDGVAISFITDKDEDIMYGLKAYLRSTESSVPDQLDRHPASQAPVGTRRDDGELVNRERKSVQYAKK
eukprot:TRINITY_DN906_c0_g1_i6.p1 TRINITY_DN906_c0_g1~~TRINITY_DN906_c0_g1_i6.p1  ORF type:complete len:809 (-),score=338.54 TRINITY_DN906_c0_g1_i6:292-2574(-)